MIVLYIMGYYSLTHAANYGEVYRKAFLEHFHCSIALTLLYKYVKQKITSNSRQQHSHARYTKLCN